MRYPGAYTFRDGETLKEVIERAGGLTDNAFPRVRSSPEKSYAALKLNAFAKRKIACRETSWAFSLKVMDWV